MAAALLSMALWGGVLLGVASCDRQPPGAVPGKVHWDRDSDPHCGMVVSDRRFAAQTFSPQGRQYVFDEMGCLVLWLQDQPWQDTAPIWVRDYRADRWLDGRKARYGRMADSPAGHGYAAGEGEDFGTMDFSAMRQAVLAQPRPGAPVAPTSGNAGS